MSFKIVFVIGSLETGGAENQLAHLATGLAKRGWNVTVLSYLPVMFDSRAAMLMAGDVNVLSVNSGTGISKSLGLLRAGRALRRLQPDILTGFMFHGIMTARIFGRLWQIPANVSAIRTERDRLYREWLLRWTDHFTSAVTVMSPCLASRLAERRIVGSVHTHVIPNGVDVAPFDSAAAGRGRIRRDLGIGEDEFLWLAAGRLHQQKDYPSLLRGFSELARRQSRARLMIAGDGPLRSTLSNLIEQSGMGCRVRLLGWQEDLPGLFAACDAIVLSSPSEGMPGVILEAMAAKKPIVATSVGAVPEMITDNAHEFMVPPKDPDALTQAMECMMELSEESRSELTESGYARVRLMYSINETVDLWESLFHRLLAHQPGR